MDVGGSMDPYHEPVSRLLTALHEERGLRETLASMRQKGLRYLSDADARGAGRAHPLANLWDNGSDPLDELEEVFAVRAWALDRFDVDRVDLFTFNKRTRL